MNRFESLSFIKDGQWAPERPTDYLAATEAGRAYAAELVEAMREAHNPTYFGAVMRLITASGEFSAVEIGFCTEFSIRLIV